MRGSARRIAFDQEAVEQVAGEGGGRRDGGGLAAGRASGAGARLVLAGEQEQQLARRVGRRGQQRRDRGRPVGHVVAQAGVRAQVDLRRAARARNRRIRL